MTKIVSGEENKKKLYIVSTTSSKAWYAKREKSLLEGIFFRDKKTSLCECLGVLRSIFLKILIFGAWGRAITDATIGSANSLGLQNNEVEPNVQ